MKISLKAARVNAGLTQDDVASKLEIHVQTYRKLEENSDLATIAQAKILAELFNIPYDEIFFAK